MEFILSFFLVNPYLVISERGHRPLKRLLGLEVLAREDHPGELTYQPVAPIGLLKQT